jgi:2-oxoisovalerate dehydrogenase E1 component
MTLAPPVATYRGIPHGELLEDFRTACISRAMDDREIALQKQSRVFFQISGAGHEALLLGLARSLRPGEDWFFPYYRDQALLLGLGVSPRTLLLQAVGSAEDPASGGRQMPSHWGDVGRHVVTQSSPTGTQCLPAVGCAEAGRYIVRRDLPGCTATGDELTYVSLGEGATSEGEFWESLNTACRLHLPVLFLVADNGYAISVRASDQAPAPISELVQGFRGLAVTKLDGRDYFEARTTGAHAIARVRAGEGPGLLHAKVTRPYSHSAADTQSKYRPPEELEDDVAHDPIALLERELVGAGILTAEAAAEIRAGAVAEVADAARSVLTAAAPDPATVTDHVYVLPDVGPERPLPDGGAPVGFGEAIRLTLHEQLAADERIRVFGEDVADAPEAVLANVEGKGGVFGTTHGLQRSFGIARCYNTPLAEANIVGRAVGQAIRGLRPAPEVQFFDYVWPAMQQIKSEAATIRWRSNGAFTCPMVLRIPIGGYLTGGAIWHSQCGESIFTHIPGLLVAFPSRARDAAGLLRTAFKCEDPVLFLEHKHLLRQPYAADPFPPEGWTIPFGSAAVVQPGDDLTIVTYGATVEKSRQAAAQLDASVEILDLRTLSPWDRERVGDSVRRTGRALVVHEDVLTSGFGAEVAAWIGEACFDSLRAPVRRVAALDTHVGYAPVLEKATLPQTDDILAAARALLAFDAGPGRSVAVRPSPAPAAAVPVAGPGDRVVPFSNIRRRTAEHMVRSQATSAHAFISTEVDYGAVDRVRRAAGLTYLPFVMRAVVDALGEFPSVNASVGDDELHVHPDIHLGVAVDLDFAGLVVPVIKDAAAKDLRALGAAVADLGTRARAKRLTAADLEGGTFTLTNPGPAGTALSVPVINQPQVAILSTDGVRPRPVADADGAIRVRPVGVLGLSFDHRAFDGAYAAAFLARIRDVLQTRDWSTEV